MEKQLCYACKLCSVEPLWISEVGHTVLAKLLESHIWKQPTGSMGLRTQQRGNGICSPWCQTLQSLPVYDWCPSSCHPGAGAQWEWVWVGESMCGFFNRNHFGLQQPLPPTQSPLVFAHSFGHLSSWHWYPGVGVWCGSGTPHSQDILP